MTSSARQQALILLMSVGFIFALFGKSLGLPEWTGTAGAIFGGFCAVSGLIIQRRARKRDDPRAVPGTPGGNRSLTWLLIAVLFVSCLGWPFVPPSAYGGAPLPLGQRLIIGAAIFVVATPLIIVLRRRREKS